MPVSLKRIASTDSLVMETKCEICGAPALFGTEVKYRAALNAIDAGDKVRAKKYLGKWWCKEHKPA